MRDILPAAAQAIVVCRPNMRSDLDGEWVTVVIQSVSLKDDGFVQITTDKGAFKRSDCYASVSPYGWQRENVNA